MQNSKVKYKKNIKNLKNLAENSLYNSSYQIQNISKEQNSYSTFHKTEEIITNNNSNINYLHNNNQNFTHISDINNNFFNFNHNNSVEENQKLKFNNSPLLSFGKTQNNFTEIINIEEKELTEEEFSLCNICSEIIKNNEIIYSCGCKSLSHVSCFVDYMNSNGKLINNPCELCADEFKIFNYKISSLDYQYYSNSLHKEVFYYPKKGFNKGQISQRDTNVNCLQNYEEFCCLAKELSHSRMSELINKSISLNLNNNSNLTYDEISKIPLSPIPKNNTPYTEKHLRQCFMQGNSENNNNSLESNIFLYFFKFF